VCWLKIDTERRKARLTSIAPTAPIVLCVSKAETLEWLREYLESRGGCAHSADVVQDAAEAGISKRTLQRAAKGLEVVYGRTRERRSIWFSPQTAKCSANPLAPPSCGEVARNGAMLVSGISPNLEQSGASKLSEPDSETCRR
jgi:hypothetical protein